MALCAVVATSALFHAFDVTYVARMGLAATYFGVLQRVTKARRGATTLGRLLKWQVSNERVTTRDLDFMGHLNNAKYSRKADFSRGRLMFEMGLYHAAQELGAGFVVGSISQRFRRELNLGERFDIWVRISGWDDRSFYIEHVFMKRRAVTTAAAAAARTALKAANTSKLESVRPTQASTSAAPANDGEPAVASREAIGRAVEYYSNVLRSAPDVEIASVLVMRMHLIPLQPVPAPTPANHGQKPGCVSMPTPADVLARLGCPVPKIMPPPTDTLAWSKSVQDLSARIIAPRSKL
jgi:acyl-CoA thioesterase FadM